MRAENGIVIIYATDRAMPCSRMKEGQTVLPFERRYFPPLGGALFEDGEGGRGALPAANKVFDCAFPPIDRSLWEAESNFMRLLILVFLSGSVFAAQGNQHLSYQENYPRSGHWYEFSVESFFKEFAEAISVQDFLSEKIYSGKSVRIIHIYVGANNKNCKEKIIETRTRKLTIPTDPKRMTHVFVTYDEDINLKSGH